MGVAFGLSCGGAGSLFWIFVSALFASVIKYAESSLAASYKVENQGGMPYVIRAVFKRAGCPLSAIYALLCLGLSFVMGAALQSKSAVESAALATEGNPSVFALVFTLLVLLVVLRGGGFVESVTAIAIPCATVVYVILCLSLIAFNIGKIPSVLSAVFRDAFNFRSAVGGTLGFLFSRSVKEGFARGLLSNEAGAGTSAMAQSRAEREHPAEVGLLGIVEVFFDTVLLCGLTGIAVLCAVPDPSAYESGMEIVTLAVSSLFGGAGRLIIFLLIALFAYSTVICWYFYGTQCMKFLFGREKSRIYTVLFIYSVFVGFLIPSSILIYTSDYFLLFMSVLTLLTLLKSSERIIGLSEQYGLLKKSDVGKGRNASGGKKGKL